MFTTLCPSGRNRLARALTPPGYFRIHFTAGFQCPPEWSDSLYAGSLSLGGGVGGDPGKNPCRDRTGKVCPVLFRKRGTQFIDGDDPALVGFASINASTSRGAGMTKRPLPQRLLFCLGRQVDLTRKEYDLLQYLVLNHDKVLTRQQLYEHIWGNFLDDQYDSNFIDVHIKNLRKKLNPHAPTPWLETVRGVGYRVSL